MDRKTKIAIIGMGYVGLPLAIEFGKIKKTVGFDIDNLRVNQLSNGIDSSKEIDTEKFSESKFLSFTSNPKSIKNCNFFIITVPTPVDESNTPDLTFLESASSTIAKLLKKGDIVIYESTVYPGCTEEVCIPILEKVSKLKFNKDFFCGYSPERINPGDKINTINSIVKVTSGSNKKTAQKVNDLYSLIVHAGTHLAPSIKVAEAAKVIENTQRDLNIALINELSIIFSKLDIDTLDVIEAARTKWNFLDFKPGLVGGHCIGVDPYYLTYKAEKEGYNSQVILSGRRINDEMGTYVARSFIKEIISSQINLKNCRVGIMGVTFKENCSDIRNSKVLDLINELKEWGIEVLVTDPWADKKELRKEFGMKLTETKDFKNLDAILIAVAHDKFRDIPINEMKSLCKGKRPLLADIKGIIDRKTAKKNGFNLFRL